MLDLHGVLGGRILLSIFLKTHTIEVNNVHVGDSINNNNIYYLQLGCYPVAMVILHVYKTRNRLLLNLSREGYVRSR